MVCLLCSPSQSLWPLFPPSTSARLPLRSGGITSRFAVGRASGRDDQRFPPLHRPIERLGKRPPRLAGEPCPAPLLSGLSGAEGGGCPPPQGLLGFGGGATCLPPPRVRGLLSGGRGLGSVVGLVDEGLPPLWLSWQTRAQQELPCGSPRRTGVQAEPFRFGASNVDIVSQLSGRGGLFLPSSSAPPLPGTSDTGGRVSVSLLIGVAGAG